MEAGDNVLGQRVGDVHFDRVIGQGLVYGLNQRVASAARLLALAENSFD